MKKTHKILVGVVLTAIFIGGVLLLNQKGEEAQLRSECFYIDYGNTIPTDADYYLFNSEGTVIEYDIPNEEEKEYPAIGIYEVFATGNVKATISVEIVDVEPPYFKEANNRTVPLNTELTEEDIIDFFVVEDLQEVVITIATDYDKTTEGDYEVIATATDASDNVTSFAIMITVSKDVKEITEGDRGVFVYDGVPQYENVGDEPEVNVEDESEEDSSSDTPDSSSSSSSGSSNSSNSGSSNSSSSSSNNSNSGSSNSSSSGSSNSSSSNSSNSGSSNSGSSSSNNSNSGSSNSNSSNSGSGSSDEGDWFDAYTDAELKEMIIDSLVWKNERTGETYYGLDNLEFGWEMYKEGLVPSVEGVSPDGTMSAAYIGLILVENPYNINLGRDFEKQYGSDATMKTTFYPEIYLFDDDYDDYRFFTLEPFTVKPATVKISQKEMCAMYGLPYVEY